MFIYLPNVLSTIPGGWLIPILFFAAVIFAAPSPLVNLFEAPTATLQELFHLKRPAAAAITGGSRHPGWAGHRPHRGPLDEHLLHLHLSPGALLAAVMFFFGSAAGSSWRSR